MEPGGVVQVQPEAKRRSRADTALLGDQFDIQRIAGGGRMEQGCQEQGTEETDQAHGGDDTTSGENCKEGAGRPILAV